MRNIFTDRCRCCNSEEDEEEEEISFSKESKSVLSMKQANRRTVKIDSNIRDDWSRINQMSSNAALHRDQTDSNLRFILENEREHASNQIN